MIVKNQRQKNRKLIIRRLICILTIILLCVVFFYLKKINTKLSNQNENYVYQIDTLKDNIKKENAKKEVLEERKNTINSNENIEKIAREQFGFIKGNEIILKPEN